MAVGFEILTYNFSITILYLYNKTNINFFQGSQDRRIQSNQQEPRWWQRWQLRAAPLGPSALGACMILTPMLRFHARLSMPGNERDAHFPRALRDQLVRSPIGNGSSLGESTSQQSGSLNITAEHLLDPYIFNGPKYILGKYKLGKYQWTDGVACPVWQSKCWMTLFLTQLGPTYWPLLIWILQEIAILLTPSLREYKRFCCPT